MKNNGFNKFEIDITLGKLEYNAEKVLHIVFGSHWMNDFQLMMMN